MVGDRFQPWKIIQPVSPDEYNNILPVPVLDFVIIPDQGADKIYRHIIMNKKLSRPVFWHLFIDMIRTQLCDYCSREQYNIAGPNKVFHEYIGTICRNMFSYFKRHHQVKTPFDIQGLFEIRDAQEIFIQLENIFSNIGPFNTQQVMSIEIFLPYFQQPSCCSS